MPSEMTSRKERRISGADEPSAISVRLAIVGFQIRKCIGWPLTIFVFSLEVITSIEVMNTSAPKATPRKMSARAGARARQHGGKEEARGRGRVSAARKESPWNDPGGSCRDGGGGQGFHLDAVRPNRRRHEAHATRGRHTRRVQRPRRTHSCPHAASPQPSASKLWGTRAPDAAKGKAPGAAVSACTGPLPLPIWRATDGAWRHASARGGHAAGRAEVCEHGRRAAPDGSGSRPVRLAWLRTAKK